MIPGYNNTPPRSALRRAAVPKPRGSAPRGTMPLERDRLGAFATRADVNDLARITDQFDLEDGQPLLRSVPPERLRELEAHAAQSALPPLRRLTASWRIDMRGRAIDVPQGDTLVVTPALTWPAAAIPGTGHYCFVGMLDHPTDPAPPSPPATDWNGFLGFISGQNNVAWRNFNVVDTLDDPAADHYAAALLIVNALDARRVFDFVIEQRLARGVQVALEVPLIILKPFTTGLDLTVETDW